MLLLHHCQDNNIQCVWSDTTNKVRLARRLKRVLIWTLRHVLIWNRCFEIELSQGCEILGLSAPSFHNDTPSDGMVRNLPQWLGLCSLSRPWDSPWKPAFSASSACLSLSFSLAQRLTLLSLSVVSRWFASTHCHPSVRPWPIKLAPAPISLLQLRWLFLDSIPPLISSSEISLHGSRGLVVVGC